MKNIFLGEINYLFDIMKLYDSFAFYEDPKIEIVEEILGYSLHDSIKIIFISKDYKIDREKIVKNLQNEILLLEDSIYNVNFLKKYEYTKLNPEVLTEIIAKKLKIENPPLFKKNIFENLYKYQITGEIINNEMHFILMDPIKFFRSQLYSLENNSSSQTLLLKSILYRLEYSFKLTGLMGLPVFYMLFKKIIPQNTKL